MKLTDKEWYWIFQGLDMLVSDLEPLEADGTENPERAKTCAEILKTHDKLVGIKVRQEIKKELKKSKV